VSPTTEKIYSDDWNAFRNWCLDHRAPYLPAPPAIVAAYLAERATTLGRSGLRLVLAAIAFHHRRAGHLWSSGDPVIATVKRGILREQKRPVRPAAAITSTEIRLLLSGCGDDPGGAAGLPGLRDRALLLACFAGGLRRSELVALDREDTRFTPGGAGAAHSPVQRRPGRGRGGGRDRSWQPGAYLSGARHGDLAAPCRHHLWRGLPAADRSRHQ
jgi:integrase